MANDEKQVSQVESQAGQRCVIETNRLQLCQLALEDAEFVVQLVNEPGWLRFIGDRGIHTIAQAEAYLRNGPMASYAANGFGLFLVRRKVDGQRLGMCGLVKRPSLPHVDIGFAFLTEFMGQGYAFESATAVLRHAQFDLKISPVVAIVDPANERSIKLLKKLGLEMQGNIQVAEGRPPVLLFHPARQ